MEGDFPFPDFIQAVLPLRNMQQRCNIGLCQTAFFPNLPQPWIKIHDTVLLTRPAGKRRLVIPDKAGAVQPPYDPERKNPILLEAGDYIRFIPVDEGEYKRIKELVERNEYECTVREGEV